MSLLDFARGPALQGAFVIFVAGVLWRLLSVLLLPWARHQSPPRPGTPARVVAAARGFLRHMRLRPPYGADALFTIINGYLFHLGLVVIVLGLAQHILFIGGLLDVRWPSLPSGIISAVSVLTLASLFLSLGRRLASPVLRLISTANDYFSWLVTVLPVLTGLVAVSHLWLRYETLLAVHMLSVALLLAWFPFGKLMHAFLVFLTRSETGILYGRRGVSI